MRCRWWRSLHRGYESHPEMECWMSKVFLLLGQRGIVLISCGALVESCRQERMARPDVDTSSGRRCSDLRWPLLSLSIDYSECSCVSSWISLDAVAIRCIETHLSSPYVNLVPNSSPGAVCSSSESTAVLNARPLSSTFSES